MAAADGSWPATGPGQPRRADLGELAPLLERRLSPVLVGAVARSKVSSACRHLPLTCLTALELRLGRADRSPVDLSVRFGAGDALALRPAARPPHLGRFIDSWSHGAWPAVAWLWLEYDLDEPLPRDRPPLPNVAAALAPGAPEPLASGVLDALAGRPTPAAWRTRLRRCLDALPAGSRLLYVFSMLSRPGRPARLEIGGLTFDALLRYLERVAGAEMARRAEELRRVAGGAEPHHLALDVSEEVEPRFGIDCSFPRLPHRDGRWRGLLDGLVGAGLCRAEEREALLAWTGYDTFRTGFAHWPPSAGLGCAVVRGLSHVKLVSVPGRPPEAKAYLMLQLLAPRTSPRRSRRPRERWDAGGRSAANTR